MIIQHKNRTVNVSLAKSECQLGCLLSGTYIYKGIKKKIMGSLDIVFLYVSNTVFDHKWLNDLLKHNHNSRNRWS